jgi:hypothetical protein
MLRRAATRFVAVRNPDAAFSFSFFCLREGFLCSLSLSPRLPSLSLSLALLEHTHTRVERTVPLALITTSQLGREGREEKEREKRGEERRGPRSGEREKENASKVAASHP